MYYFFLGNTPALSRLELEALLPIDSPLTSVVPSVLATPTLPNPEFLTHRLGGIRKLATEYSRAPRQDVLAHLKTAFSALPNKNVAVTDYAGMNLTKSDLHQLKSELTRPIRFVSLDTHEHELILLSHQHVAELNLLPDGADVIIALTTWIFDAESWIQRDRRKPYRDIHRGMLPPKLARILVNLATRGEAPSLYDPFCGTGTVLSEAALVGIPTLYGSDTNPDAIAGTRANLAWVQSSLPLPSPAPALLELADATHPPFTQVDAIATEPYMGPLLDERNPLPFDKIKDIARGLDKLYRGAAKAWLPLLPPSGRVVITLPSFAVYGRVVPTISVDTLVSLGYNYISSVAYGKPGATVIRNITILEKK